MHCTHFFIILTDPPKFVPPPSSTVVGVEGEPLQVPLMANANPVSITYIWSKDGLPIPNGSEGRIISEGAILNITKLHRNDGGIYTCEATNSQGTASINITVVVECKYTFFWHILLSFFSTNIEKLQLQIILEK